MHCHVESRLILVGAICGLGVPVLVVPRSTIRSSGAKNKKSTAHANANVIAMRTPVVTLGEKLEADSTENPATNTTVVMVSATPTVLKV